MTGQEFTFDRTFDAPRAQVYRAFTDPELIARWWAPKDEQLAVEVLDPRPGGSWRFLNTDADGVATAFHGVFHSVAEDRIVQTFEYGGVPGVVLLETLTFTDLGDGRTRFTDSSLFPAAAAGAFGGGGGASGAMDRLAELLATL